MRQCKTNVKTKKIACTWRVIVSGYKGVTYRISFPGEVTVSREYASYLYIEMVSIGARHLPGNGNVLTISFHIQSATSCLESGSYRNTPRFIFSTLVVFLSLLSINCVQGVTVGDWGGSYLWVKVALLVGASRVSIKRTVVLLVSSVLQHQYRGLLPCEPAGWGGSDSNLAPQLAVSVERSTLWPWQCCPRPIYARHDKVKETSWTAQKADVIQSPWSRPMSAPHLFCSRWM